MSTCSAAQHNESCQKKIDTLTLISIIMKCLLPIQTKVNAENPLEIKRPTGKTENPLPKGHAVKSLGSSSPQRRPAFWLHQSCPHTLASRSGNKKKDSYLTRNCTKFLSSCGLSKEKYEASKENFQVALGSLLLLDQKIDP